MDIKASKKKATVQQDLKIGYFKGELVAINPSKAELQKLYKTEEDIEEPVYTGKDKNDADWTLLRFMFLEDITKEPVDYRVFLKKDLSEFEKDDVQKCWWVNQFGQTQVVANEKDLFRSFMYLQKWNKVESKMEDVPGEDGKPIKLTYRKCWKGEKQIYDFLQKLVTQDWFNADQETSILVKFDSLMKNNVKELSSWIGTENYQSVVGMIEIAAKDGDNGTNYYQNCVDGAWMPGWKIKEANIATASNSWDKWEQKPKGKGSYKLKDMHEFYMATKRNRNITEFAPIHEFVAADHMAAGDATIKHSEGTGSKSTAPVDDDY